MDVDEILHELKDIGVLEERLKRIQVPTVSPVDATVPAPPPVPEIDTASALAEQLTFLLADIRVATRNMLDASSLLKQRAAVLAAKPEKIEKAEKVVPKKPRKYTKKLKAAPEEPVLRTSSVSAVVEKSTPQPTPLEQARARALAKIRGEASEVAEVEPDADLPYVGQHRLLPDASGEFLRR